MKKLNNFLNAINTLNAYSDISFDKYSEIERDLFMTGYINHFEKTFELSWKLCKQILEYEGVSEAETGSPMQIIKLSYKYGLIYDEQCWKELLQFRNNVVHCYEPSEILNYVNIIKSKYIDVFDDISTIMKSRIHKLNIEGLIPKAEIDETLEELSDDETEEFHM